jgi:hypothetical protein
MYGSAISTTLHTLKFTAILGDLVHKQDVYLLRQDYLQSTTCLFANREQASFLVSHHFNLVPPGNWSPHSLGTFFEYFYYTNLTFRFSYLALLPQLSCSDFE